MNAWFLLHHDECLGPYTLKEVKLLFAASYLVRTEGETSWVPAGQHPGLKAFFAQRSVAAIPVRTTRLQRVTSWLEETVFPQVQWFRENRKHQKTTRRNRSVSLSADTVRQLKQAGLC